VVFQKKKTRLAVLSQLLSITGLDDSRNVQVKIRIIIVIENDEVLSENKKVHSCLKTLATKN
jgi:hypothetical protein